MAEGLSGSGMADIKFQTICIAANTIIEFSKPSVDMHRCVLRLTYLVENKE